MSNSILVVGGGFAGLTAAIEAAELGHDVYIVEKSPYLGGRVAQLNKYFPKLCPPSCGLEIQFQRIRKNPRIKFFTMAEVTKLVGCKGDYTATVSIKPRKVAAHNVDFTLLASSLEGTVPNEFDFGLHFYSDQIIIEHKYHLLLHSLLHSHPRPYRRPSQGSCRCRHTHPS